MKTSSVPRSCSAIDRPTAWACLLANLLVLPGLGSVTVGRRSGYAQAALALTGVGLTLFWCGWVVIQWKRSGQLPETVGPYFWTALAGIGLFALAWSWALVSSIRLLLSSHQHPPEMGNG